MSVSLWMHRQAYLDRPGVGLGVSCTLAALVVTVLVGPAVLLHPSSAAIGLNPASDFQVMTWSLEWWPWAIGHGVDPLHAHLLWPPEGFSTLWMTTIPVPALLAAPLTLLAGPLVAYNALMLLSVVLATGAAYLLCRELTGRPVPSLAGGLLFGLSPYMLGHMLSQHLDLTFVFPVPLLALLVVRHVRGRMGRGRFVTGFALLLLVELGSSFELFVDLTLVLAVGLALALLGSSWRPRVLRTGALVGLGYAACLPILVPVAVLALSRQHASLRYAPANFSIDLLNALLPTPTLLAGRLAAARAVSQHFVSNVGEQNGYLGIPLLLVAALGVRSGWRRGAWLAGGLLVATLLLSFGPTLTVDGRPIVSLPFGISGLPVVRDALPVRMSLFTALAAACLCAIWLARSRRPAVRMAAGVLVGVSLLPNFWPAHRLPGAWSVSDAFAWSTPHVPVGFVEGHSWTRVITPGSTVLVLPTGDRTAASYWQASTGMRFRLAVPATPFVPSSLEGAPTVSGLVEDVMPRLAGSALAAARLRAFLEADHVAAVVVMPSGASRWRRIVARATGARPVTLQEARVYRVKRMLRPLRALGDLAVAHAPDPDRVLVSDRDANATLSAWLAFDGRRAHVHALLRRPHASSRAVVLSSPQSDSDATAVAVGAHGRAAVLFTEWRADVQMLRIALHIDGRWRVVTLDRQTGPIWSPHVVVTPRGTTVAAWIDETDPTERSEWRSSPRMAPCEGRSRSRTETVSGTWCCPRAGATVSSPRGTSQSKTSGASASPPTNAASGAGSRRSSAVSTCSTTSRSHGRMRASYAGWRGIPGAVTSSASRHVPAAPVGWWEGPPCRASVGPYTCWRGTRDGGTGLLVEERVVAPRHCCDCRVVAHGGRACAVDPSLGSRVEPSLGR